MEHREPLFEKDPLSLNVPAGTVVTRDHEIIQRWAEIRHAEPATGEATASGPAKIDVNDGGSGMRFNFQGPRSSGQSAGTSGSRTSMSMNWCLCIRNRWPIRKAQSTISTN